MKITLDLSPAVQKRGGMGRYAEELGRALLVAKSGDQVSVFCADRLGRKPGPPLNGLECRVVRCANKPWRMSVLAAGLVRLPCDRLFGNADVFHSTDHLLPPTRRVRSVFTLHDLSFLTRPETHLPSNRWFLRAVMPLFLRRADAVICVSQHTKEDAVRIYGLPSSKLHVVPEGVDSRFCPVEESATIASVRERYRLPDRFILSVGTIEPRKNLHTLLLAYERLKRSVPLAPRLVIVGRKGWMADQFFAALARSPIKDDVIIAGMVADDDLPAIYSAADLFVYPSVYEGFGLPPLESMACGTPVVVSNSSSLPEVVGDAGLLVDPLNADALADAMGSVLNDRSLRTAMRTKGLVRAGYFTWAAAALQTLVVYHSVLERAPNEAI